ncbi:MAG: hypothetical protein CMP11_04310 [Zetaproteobacteria bacterium]|nr:hypothetical protein [Pseudobdellovibrionaceae bacterium]|tara:strand:+ start:97 stop:477 length:381 start_codon:yes stop_codon:yes gene_type:complete
MTENEDFKNQEQKSKPQDQLTLEDIVFLINKIGLEYIEAKREYDKHDLLKTSHRARIMEKHDNGQRSESKIRRLAEMDDEYLDILSQLNKTKYNYERLKVRYESYKNLFEARRSMLSYQKAEMKLL